MMSRADELQNNHRVPAALRERQRSIANGTATWHDYHQAGVLLSELAESSWWIKGRHWARLSQALSLRAIKLYDMARTRTTETLELTAINCDTAMAWARRGRTDGYAYYQAGMEAINSVHALLSSQAGETTAQSPPQPHLHQLAITASIRCRMAWGRTLGLGAQRDDGSIIVYSNQALSLFEKEAGSSPDGERAYRSLLISQALGHAAYGGTESQRLYAERAIQSARYHRDRMHFMRAHLIKTYGTRGERLMRLIRDGRALSAF